MNIVPLDLRHFGTNPFGKNIWRVVSAPSRTHKVGYDDNGLVRFRELPIYPGNRGWVLERWLPAEKYAGSREGWELQERTNDIKLGPYPSEGEWCGCGDIYEEIPTQSQVELTIRMILYGSRFSIEDHKRANREVLEKEESDWLKRAEDIFHDSQPAFGHKATNLNPAKLTPDKVNLGVAAEDLNMPVGDGKFFQN